MAMKVLHESYNTTTHDLPDNMMYALVLGPLAFRHRHAYVLGNCSCLYVCMYVCACMYTVDSLKWKFTSLILSGGTNKYKQ